MANLNVNDRIEKYIDKIETVYEGQRDRELYNTGQCFRGTFGLQGTELNEWLHVVNEKKCSPPLPDSDVHKIARQVDKSDCVPLGNDSARCANKPAKKNNTKKEYTISIAETPVAIDEYLTKRQVSLYKNAYGKQPTGKTSIGVILDKIRTGGKSKEQIIKIRNEPDKDKRDELKKQLTAFVLGSEPQQQRKNEYCKHNGIICIDFDNIPIDKIESAKTAIAAVGYIFAVGLSVSGEGLFALAAYEGTPDLKYLLAGMQNDFHYPVDTSRSDLCGLRFVTLDENLVVKEKVYPAVLSEQAELEPAVAHRETGVAVLDSILAKIKRVNWRQYCGEKKEEPSEQDYILRTIERTLETAVAAGHPIVDKNGTIYCYTGTHYRVIDVSELRNFLIETAIRCGVPSDKAIYFFFVDKLIRQFYINAGRQGTFTKEPNTAFINLKNGTLFFDKGKHRFEPHTPERFIRYVLDFDYNPKATTPRWQQHLDRSLPHPDKQMYLAKCLALPFYKGKIEKAPILYGQRDTGKSTTLDVYKVLVGAENISTETLAALTQTDYQGDYARARLDGKLVNIASDVSKKISDEGLAKTLISREAVSARRPHKEGFNMKDYARLVFAMNELPPQFFSDAALAKRAAIIEFDQQVTPQKKDTDFAEKIIANELPGVLNWIINGLTRLNAAGRLDAPLCCVEAMDKIRKENDPLSGWLGEQEYSVGNQSSITVKDAYENFKEYCRDNGNNTPSKKTFTRRLRDAGYKTDRPNNHVGVVLYYTNSFLENASHASHESPTLENKGENGDLSGTETGTDSVPKNESPDKSPMSPHFHAVNIGTGTNGTDGTENSEEFFDGDASVVRCPKCVHHVPATYPEGFCAEGYCQLNLPCHDFSMKTDTPSSTVPEDLF